MVLTASLVDMNPHITVVQSSLPSKDADTIISLVPNLYEQKESTNNSIVLSAKGSSFYLLLILVYSPALTNGAITPLLASEEHIRTAQSNCIDNDGASLVFAKTVFMPSGQTCTLCSISLKGGTKILLTPPTLATFSEGRKMLALALTIPTSSSPDAVKRLKENNSVSTNATEIGFVDVPFEQESASMLEPTGKAIMDEAKPPAFPSLAVSLLGKDGEYKPNFSLNSHDAVPVETDLFVGRMLMILRPIQLEDDPYWNDRVFSKRKRRLIFQLQGKFKRVPKGTLYAGGEISEQMRLGLVAKGLCGILLRLVKQFAPDTHYSFGDSKNLEKPHIVIPAWSFFERLIVTEPGKDPPEMGDDFVEPEESVAARKSLKSTAQWNTDCTYSFSFHTMYMDLVKWQIVQLPVTNDIDLKTFWGNSFMRIVLYENTTPSNERLHLQKDNSYFFSIELRRIVKAPTTDEEGPEIATSLPWPNARLTSMPRSLKDIGRQDSGMILVDSDSEDFYDAADEASLHEAEVESSFFLGNVIPSKSMDLLLTIDSVCPALVEIYHKGKYAKTYAFNLSKKNVTVFRTAALVEKSFATSKAKQIVDETWSPRLSSSEKCRRVVGHTISQALLDKTPGSKTRLEQFEGSQTVFDQDFLRRPPPTWIAKQRHKVRHCGFGARAVSDRHWMEEFIQVTDRHLLLHHPDRQKAHFRVALQSIVDVKILLPEDSPLMPSFSFFAITTLGRTVYLMLPPDVNCNDWVDLIVGLTTVRIGTDPRLSFDSQSVASDHSMAFDDPAEEFLQDSSLFNCKQRRILNGRRFSFRAQNCQTENPAALVEEALVRAFEPNDDSEETSLVAFLDSASALKDVDVCHLGEAERLAFFLNLYHLMIMHAYLVLGPPDSALKAIGYFNTIAYQCSDDIFSLTELEHCIIRAAMNYPAQFVSKFVLPKSSFHFALTQPDYRINFALNCGSVSSPVHTTVYRWNTLDDQLDWASRLYLKTTAEARPSSRWVGGVTLTLPRVCQWFAEDFGNGSTNDVVRSIERFLEDDQRQLVASCYAEREQRYILSNLNVKYSSFSFECRNLKLATGDSIITG